MIPAHTEVQFSIAWGGDTLVNADIRTMEKIEYVNFGMGQYDVTITYLSGTTDTERFNTLGTYWEIFNAIVYLHEYPLIDGNISDITNLSGNCASFRTHAFDLKRNVTCIGDIAKKDNNGFPRWEFPINIGTEVITAYAYEQDLATYFQNTMRLEFGKLHD